MSIRQFVFNYCLHLDVRRTSSSHLVDCL